MNPLPIFNQAYVLTTNFYDHRNTLSLQGTLDLMQNCAARHAYLLGAGREDLLKESLYWVIARTEIEYISFPSLPTDVLVTTWPLAPNRFYFDRHYKIVDQGSGQLIAKARSRWVLVDAKTRKIISSNRYAYPLSDFHHESLFNEDFSRIIAPQVKVGQYVVQPSDIDENGHLNNARYGNIIFNILNQEEVHRIKSITINYSNEAFLHQQIALFKEIKSSSISISGVIDDKIIFSSEVKI